MVTSRSILISGGGIAGLTAALCLTRAGFRVDLFERARLFDQIGAGIQLSPNALHILDDLGLGKQLRLTATTPQGIRILGASNAKQIAMVPLGAEAIVRFGLPYICIHRLDLHQSLLSACEQDPDITIHMSASVIDATVHPNGASILVQHPKSIQTHRGAAVILADGVNSPTRREIFDLPEATHSGFEAWRAMMPIENVPGSLPADYTHLILGRDRHCVLYPVKNGRYVNVVLVSKTKNKKTTSTLNADVNELTKDLGAWKKDLVALFQSIEEWSVWPLLQAPKAREWSRDNIVMIGDSAHGMVPFAAQGAAMGIEDAAVLAKQMTIGPDHASAFKAFHELRKTRVAKVAKLADTNGQLYHMGWPFSTVRNIGMRLLPAKKLLERQSWIYDWRV